MDRVRSKNGIAIRLPDERWAHVTEEHAELSEMRQEVLATVASPDRIVAGGGGELLAVRRLTERKFMVVVYRELQEDGFIITAFMTTRVSSLDRRTQLWPPSPLQSI